MAERQVFLDQLLEMGIPDDRASLSLDNTSCKSIDAALDWISSNPESDPSTATPTPTSPPADSQGAQGHTLSGHVPQVQQTPSIRCSVCGIAIFGEAHATKHATQTKHIEFEEYIPKPGEEVVAPPPDRSTLTEEEKLTRIEELRKRNEVLRQQKKTTRRTTTI